MAKTYRSRKAKGKKLEKEIAKRINETLGGYGIEAKVMPMSGSIDGWEGDVWTNMPLSIEAKNQEKINIWDCWEQTENQCNNFKIPLLVFSRNYHKNLAVLSFEDLLFFLELALQAGWMAGHEEKKKKVSIGGRK